MPFSHHSHSGEFCPGHAKDMLEAIVKTAIDKNMQVFALTEHMPRHDEDRYPEEVAERSIVESGFENQTNYYHEAVRLRKKYQGQLSIPIGFEGEFCRPESRQLIERALFEHRYDFFLGSLHHVHAIPIDYDASHYDKAKQKSGGTDERLFEDFFDEQFRMLQLTKPPVVGHFDLIRLLSARPNDSFQNMAGVWQKILRNLDFVASYGGILEINSSGLRKGLLEPYPKVEIAQAFLARQGRFVLSDDSHGIDQVAACYNQIIPYLHEVGVRALHYLGHSEETADPVDSRFPNMTIHLISVADLEQHKFWI